MRILYFQNLSSLPLNGFSEACLSLTPKVSLLKKGEIFLDISLTEKLLGGEKNILAQAESLKAAFGLKMKMVLTDRPEWARALSTSEAVIIPKGDSYLALLELPIDQIVHCGDPITLEAEMGDRVKLVAFMKRVGLRTISDFAYLSPTAINRRFGKLGIQLQQWVMGTRPLCLAPFISEEILSEKLDAEEVHSLESLLEGLFPIFLKIEARLIGRSQIARELKFHFHLEEGSLVKNLKLSEPTREAKTILKLTQDFFRDLVWESPLLRLELSVTDSDHFTAGQLSLFDKAENKFADLNLYVERLQAKLGTQQAGFADLQESYLPEKSWKMIGDNRKLKTKNSSRIFPWLRPPILFTPPKPYAPRKDARLIPSEHLAAEWWSDGGAHRRYFIAHTFQGEKLWVFWDDQRRSWFLHGTFD